MNSASRDLFEDVREFPDLSAKRAYDRLVGLDDIKSRLHKETLLAVRPSALVEWSERCHNGQLPLVGLYRDRPPLFVFAGDVGTGKTALAETFGDPIARALGVPVSLYRLSLRARGTGAVGEMTRLLGMAFDEVRDAAASMAKRGGDARGAIIMVVDEADALAQSRELAQMHHEDRAGVNALIRGVSDLAGRQLPVLVVMCTNRLGALDPAVRRRAAAIFRFRRPDLAQRTALLDVSLDGVGLGEEQLQALAAALGERQGRDYGHTYSDIVERFLPTAILDAFPDRPLTYEILMQAADPVIPTRPFGDEESQEE